MDNKYTYNPNKHRIATKAPITIRAFVMTFFLNLRIGTRGCLIAIINTNAVKTIAKILKPMLRDNIKLWQKK